MSAAYEALSAWRPTDDQRALFWSRVDKNGPVVREGLGKCWIWTGSRIKRGYGTFSIHSANWSNEGAHRVSWVLVGGEIPPGAFVLHSCDNPPCVNPAHLFLGDHAINMADKKRKGRAPGRKTATFPVWLRSDGEFNGRAKLTSAQVIEIRQLYARGVRSRELRRMFGISASTIRFIARGETWQDVGGPTTPAVAKQPPQVFEYDGFSGTMLQWSKRLDVPVVTLYSRLYKGMPFELIFSSIRLRRGKRWDESVAT